MGFSNFILPIIAVWGLQQASLAFGRPDCDPQNFARLSAAPVPSQKLGVGPATVEDVDRIVEIQMSRAVKPGDVNPDEGFLFLADTIPPAKLREQIQKNELVVYREADHTKPGQTKITAFGVAVPLDKKATDPLIDDFVFNSAESRAAFNGRVLYGREIVAEKGASGRGAFLLYKHFLDKAQNEGYPYAASMISLDPPNERSMAFSRAKGFRLVGEGVSQPSGQKWGLFLRRMGTTP